MSCKFCTLLNKMFIYKTTSPAFCIPPTTNLEWNHVPRCFMLIGSCGFIYSLAYSHLYLKKCISPLAQQWPFAGVLKFSNGVTSSLLHGIYNLSFHGSMLSGCTSSSNSFLLVTFLPPTLVINIILNHNPSSLGLFWREVIRFFSVKGQRINILDFTSHMSQSQLLNPVL